jgi:hypothetical protein
MITRTDKVYEGTLTTGSVVIDTQPANTTFVLKGFWISNANAADKKAELLINGKRILPYLKAIPTGDTLVRSDLNIPVLTTKTMAVKGEVASDMDYCIWGVLEVTS